MSFEEQSEKCISRTSIAVESLNLCLRIPTSTKENHLSLFRRTKTPVLINRLIVRAPLAAPSPDQPVAGPAVSEPPAVSPTARIEETIPRWEKSPEQEAGWRDSADPNPLDDLEDLAQKHHRGDDK